MKRNVDLTLRRDFKDDNDEFDKFHRIILERIHGKNVSRIPWKIYAITEVRSDEDLIQDNELRYENIIITGSKSKRKNTKKYRYLNKDICDCCGIEFKIPWKRKYGLCIECSKNFSNERLPWKQGFEKEEKRIAWR